MTPVPGDEQIKIGVLLDVETTGLDAKTDKVIELGMVKFADHPDCRVAHVIDNFGSLNEPANSIPVEITTLTGITNEMVAGKRIDDEAVSCLWPIVIAHNANFDRKCAERYWPEFEHKNWGCSATEIDWRAHRFEGSSLGYLLMRAGLFHTAHRAVDDCRALLEVLTMPLAGTERPALASLLDRARRKTCASGRKVLPMTSRMNSKSGSIAGTTEAMGGPDHGILKSTRIRWTQK